jgi:hypothetical protein
METNQNKFGSLNSKIGEMLKGIDDLNLEIKDIVMHEIETRNLPTAVGCDLTLIAAPPGYCCCCTCCA